VARSGACDGKSERRRRPHASMNIGASTLTNQDRNGKIIGELTNTFVGGHAGEVKYLK